MTEGPAVQGLIRYRLVGSHPRSSPAAFELGLYCCGSASTSSGPAMSNAAVQQRVEEENAQQCYLFYSTNFP
ncbi:hypothetical protein T10_13616 [Trichinella papuae]|uniref:Uncharacterized protein n=1 Tax=Trichinella papuae TaxID=268474 RepID=A0A0V1MLU7_9BILA|nr:hypothetical protein T10_13616 [Trichinella papuae]